MKKKNDYNILLFSEDKDSKFYKKVKLEREYIDHITINNNGFYYDLYFNATQKIVKPTDIQMKISECYKLPLWLWNAYVVRITDIKKLRNLSIKNVYTYFDIDDTLIITFYTHNYIIWQTINDNYAEDPYMSNTSSIDPQILYKAKILNKFEHKNLKNYEIQNKTGYYG